MTIRLPSKRSVKAGLITLAVLASVWGLNQVESSFKQEKINYELEFRASLKRTGLSEKDVILRDTRFRRFDINNDRIKDYNILVREKDGTYSARVVLGYNPRNKQ